MSWLTYALISAIAAAATAVLAKVGVQGVPSHLAAAFRTVVVLVFAIGLTLATREHHAVRELKGRSVAFLFLSGIATGTSWLAYFKALSLAPASRVAPVDKLSLAFTVLMSAVWLGEPMSWKLGLGVSLMIAGAVVTLA